MTTKTMTTKTRSTKVTLPPYPVLRGALVARVEKETGTAVDLLDVAERLGLNSTDAVRKAASKALELYAGKTCWFCGTGRDKPVRAGRAVNWAAIPLCKCLDDLRQGVVWHPIYDGAGLFNAESADALNRIRRGVLRRVEEVGHIPAETPVVSRCCDELRNGKPCGSRFTLTAGMYKSCADSTIGQAAARDARNGVVRTEAERLQDFRHPSKCRECRNARRDRAAAVRTRPSKTFAQMVLETGLLTEVR